MIRLLRDFRLLPIVLVAAACLLALKVLGLAFDGGYLVADAGRRFDDPDMTGAIKPKERADTREPQAQKQSWAQQMFNYPEFTGSGPPAPKEAQPGKSDRAGAKPEEGAAAAAGWKPVPISAERQPSAAERAILERLGERRAELDARAKELEMRENLLKAAEKRLESRINELKDLEARVNDVANHKDENEIARFKNLITMYENMKAKDAAKIFDRLDMRVLLDVATQINPRRMSDILGQMAPEAAERLTVELAARAASKDGNKPQASDLPKIEGRPNPN